MPQPIKLGFFIVDASEMIRDIFRNRIARTLWMGIKNNHIVDQHFDEHCLELAHFIETRDEPLEAWALTSMLRRRNMTGLTENYGEILLPYVTEEKDIEWTERGINLMHEYA